MVSQFEHLGLLPQFVHSVEQLGFEQPTPIQQAAIPALLDGRNVLGQAQTGTGKTAAFALPMLQGIEPGNGAVQALVLAPTRELAIQVAEAASRIARCTGTHKVASVLAVYGGQPYHLQTRQLARGVDVVVGTPGRLLDLIRKELLDLSQVRYLVLDEADEMLEMGFIEDVEAILAQVPRDRQTALFSATLPAPVRKLADRYLSDPHEITINPSRRTVAETEQRFCSVREENKLAALTRLLEAEAVKSALIFARTKARAQQLAEELTQSGYPAESLHGDLNQSRREYVLNRFRRHTITLLVATDVAARGLDIEEVSHVFNYDIPADAEDYIHRIGRTGRAGRKGTAITFSTPRERSRLRGIEAFTRQAITECRIPTPEEMLMRRDERFLQRMTEQLQEGEPTQEHSLVSQLVKANFELADIAAAAIRLARAEEGSLPTADLRPPAAEPRPSHNPEHRPSAGGPPRNGRKGSRGLNRERQSEPTLRLLRDKRQREPGMVRLKMNLGEAHGLRPSDIVGAIAGEVGIPGRAIGVIDIHREHTFVDVSEKHVRRVLRESGGKYLLRGKPVMLKLAG